jgi:hypothetical protein
LETFQRLGVLGAIFQKQVIIELMGELSGPRLAISFPPFRPSLTAAGSFFFGKIQRV